MAKKKRDCRTITPNFIGHDDHKDGGNVFSLVEVDYHTGGNLTNKRVLVYVDDDGLKKLDQIVKSRMVDRHEALLREATEMMEAMRAMPKDLEADDEN